MKIHTADGGVLMTIDKIDRKGTELVLKGKAFGTMPTSIQLRPEDARAFLKMLSPTLIFFLLTLPFRKGTTNGRP